MSVLARAIKEQRWEVAALCLALGFLRAAAAIPPDALSGMLEVLEVPTGRDGLVEGETDEPQKR